MNGNGAKAIIDTFVDDRSLRSGQQRQKCLGHAVGSEQVDREVLFEDGPVAQVVVERDAGVVDEDVDERPALR